MICTKCNNEGILNEANNKKFYYCRTCKDEIFAQPKPETDFWKDTPSKPSFNPPNPYFTNNPYLSPKKHYADTSDADDDSDPFDDAFFNSASTPPYTFATNIVWDKGSVIEKRESAITPKVYGVELTFHDTSWFEELKKADANLKEMIKYNKSLWTTGNKPEAAKSILELQDLGVGKVFSGFRDLETQRELERAEAISDHVNDAMRYCLANIKKDKK